MRNRLRRELLVFKRVRYGRREGKPYRYWLSGSGLCAVEAFGHRYFAWDAFVARRGPYRSFEAAARCVERMLLASAKAMGLPSPKEIDAITAKAKESKALKRKLRVVG